MSRPIIKIHNIETGEIVEREMDNEEYAAYEANELLIAEKEKKYTFAIKPKAGSIIVFPPSPPYHHTAHLVKSGEKIMVPQHWIH